MAEQEPRLDVRRRQASVTRRPAIACLALTPLLLGQDPPAPEVPPSVLLSKLQSRDLPVDEARRLADDLRGRALAVRIDLFDAVRRAHAEHAERQARGAEQLGKEFRRAIGAAQRANVQRISAARVDELRNRARAITARADLAKETIHAELDPLLAELRTCMLPTAQQAIEQDQRLAAAVAAQARRTTDLERWYDLCLEAMQHVDGDPAGRAHAAKAPPLPPPPRSVPPDVEFEADCLLGLPLDAHDERTLLANEALRASLDPAEFAGTLELNRIRLALGLPTLRIDEKLGNAARDHSHDMRTLGFFAHESPVEGKRTFADRASRAGTSASAENIAAGHRRGEGAIQAWWYSPGHHKNMLGGHARTGLGRSEEHWTQLFGG